MHRDIFIHMKTYKETCTQTGKKKKKVKSHTHTKLPIIPSIGRKNLHTNQAMTRIQSCYQRECTVQASPGSTS